MIVEDRKRNILRDDGKSEREIVYVGREKKAIFRGRDRKREIVCVCVRGERVRVKKLVPHPTQQFLLIRFTKH